MLSRIFHACLWVSGLATLCLGYGFLIEPERLVVKRLSVGQGEFQTKIVLMSDIHIGGIHIPPERVSRLAKVINLERPDVTLMPGDFIDGHKPRAGVLETFRENVDNGLGRLAEIEGLKVASLGNHDHWYDPIHVRAELNRAKVKVVDNSGFRQDGICFVGLSDTTVSQPNADGFKICEADDLILTLMHSPDARDLLRSDVDLAVAGHTHGGQINLPLLGRLVTATECGKACAYGLIGHKPPVVVTAGIGTSILPARFRAPPEIVVITLFSD